MQFKNPKLNEYLKKRMTQGTVVLCFKVLLENVIRNGGSSKMSKAEVNRAFDNQHKKFGIGHFRSDYLLRQSSESKHNAIGVLDDNNTFFIREEFIAKLDRSDLINVVSHIESVYEQIAIKKQKLFKEIDDAKNLELAALKKFILKMLLEKETDKKGQAFEVTAFAILKTFYRIRGFELNRFSTVYANDGGIDYTSQMAVYQVTTNLSNKKFDEDINKAPLKERILVYKKSVSNFDTSLLNNELVLDYISSDDLVDHLEYLFKKRPNQNSIAILDSIKDEFKREYYL